MNIEIVLISATRILPQLIIDYNFADWLSSTAEADFWPNLEGPVTTGGRFEQNEAVG